MAVLEGDGPNALVQTILYNYHAGLADGRSLFRYDSPDLVITGETVDYHKHHHKHLYDPTQGMKEVGVEVILDENNVPTLGDVIEELEDWYYEHASELDRQ